MRAPEFWRGGTQSGAILSTLLSPLGCLYGYSVRLRQLRARPFRARARVICVGNLSAGGTGKTPIAIALARLLLARGANVVFLTRGYGGTLRGPAEVTKAHRAEDVGDEPLLLRAIAPTIVSRDRKSGARMCDAKGADVIVMDDGHQNFDIAKDLSLVAVSSGSLGNGKLIPAGPLREPMAQGLARADAVIVTGGDPRIDFSRPLLRSRLVAEEEESFRGVRVFAFAGIGEPDRFFEMLKAMGAVIAGSRAFADHHPFADGEIAALRLAAKEPGANLVTTEKDYVRLSEAQREGITPIRVRAIFENADAIEALLDRVYRSAKQQGA